MSFDESDLAKLYCLILKKQYGTATEEELEELVQLGMEYLEWSRELIRDWLLAHAQIGTFEEWLDAILNEDSPVFSQMGGFLLEEIGEKLKALGEKRYDYNEAVGHESVFVQDVVGCNISLERIARRGLRPIWECYKENMKGWDIVERMKRVLKEIDDLLENPSKYTISDLILLIDAVTDLHHSAGRLIEDYGYIDVESAKAEAEEMFEEGGCE